MNIELDGLRDGERFPFTSGKNPILNNLFKEQAKIFSPKNDEYLPDFRDELIYEGHSNCCDAPVMAETDICSACLEHCKIIYRD
jgi:hypothetical protein